MSKTLIIISGLPGSGKSKLAKELAKGFNAHILSSDDMRKYVIDLFIEEPNEYYHGSEIPMHFWGASSYSPKQLEEDTWYLYGVEFNSYITDGTNIILDATFLKRWTYEKWIMIAKEAGYDIHGYQLNIDIGIVLEQNKNRKRMVPEERIFEMAKSRNVLDPELFDCITSINRLRKNGRLVESTRIKYYNLHK